MSRELIPFRHQSAIENKSTLLLVGGAAVVVGAGLLLSPGFRRYLSETGMGLLKAALPDLERYMRIRAM